MNKIRELRERYNIKQADLARAISVSQAALSGYETGRYEPTIETLAKISDYFGVNISYLLEDFCGATHSKKMSAIHRDGGQAKKLANALQVVGLDVDDLSDDDIKRIAEIIKLVFQK